MIIITFHQSLFFHFQGASQTLFLVSHLFVIYNFLKFYKAFIFML